MLKKIFMGSIVIFFSFSAQAYHSLHKTKENSITDKSYDSLYELAKRGNRSATRNRARRRRISAARNGSRTFNTPNKTVKPVKKVSKTLPSIHNANKGNRGIKGNHALIGN